LTTRCRAWKDFLERLVSQGHLKEFINEEKTQAGPQTEPEKEDSGEVRVIDVIHGMVDAAAEETLRAEIRRVACGKQIMSVSAGSKRPHLDSQSGGNLSFSDQDLQRLQMPHNDALVVSLTLGNSLVRRILVDQGSSAEVMYYPLFKALHLQEADLHLPRCRW
jgi:hypothetical protein